MNNREIGTQKEEMAVCYLKEHGYDIIECNYRIRTGEIDIIGKNEGCLVFVEVKYRSSLYAGSPFDAVDVKKQNKIRKVAAYYIMVKHLEDVPVRFDVVGITDNDISLCKNAF